MKNFLLPLFALLFFANQTNAQLTANAGANQSVCSGSSTTLGGSPTASGGTGPYTYSWTPTVDLNNATIANPTAVVGQTFTYTVIVTDALGAKDTDQVIVTKLQRPTVSVAASDSIVCLPGVVSFTANVSNGTGPYTYNWVFGDGGTSTLLSPTHTYTTFGWYTPSLAAFDANGCRGSDNMSLQVSQIFPSVQGFLVNCAGDNGGLFPSVSGGTPGYTYMWSNGSTAQNLTNIPVGTYTVTITDSRGCSATAIGTVMERAPLISVSTFVTNESALDACDGAIDLTVSGGTPAYSYSWSNFETVEDLTGLCAGTYSVTIADAYGCRDTSLFVIDSSTCINNTLIVSINSQDLSCAHTVDTMTVNVAGGTLPYNFQWSTGDVTPQITISQAGVYNVYVTDSFGCTRSASNTLLNTGVQVSLLQNIPSSCNGVTNGALAVGVTGGTPPYTYAWNTTPTQTTDSLTNIPAGVYVLTVTDAASCVVVNDYTVQQGNTNWSYYVYISSTVANCAANGSATALPQGGTPPFSYLWSNGDTTATITGLTTGSYAVTVTGADGCSRVGNGYVHTSCYNILQGRLINDLNGNCQLDSGETPFAYHTIVANSGSQTFYGSTDAQGYYTIQLLSGTFTISPYITGSCTAACSAQNASYTQTFPSLGDSVNNINFYLVQAPIDLFVVQSWGNFRPGFTRTVSLYYGNAGTTIVNGTLTLNYDADLTFVSATNGGVHNATNHTVTWTVPNIPLTPYNYYYYQYYYNQFVSADFLTPIGTPVGTPIINTAHINVVANECDSLNNTHTATTLVTNSMDPNKKEVSPAGDIFDETTSELTYTIHFQNTGNDTAWFIVLKDTLSSYLNAGSAKNIASSHPITDFNISGEGILTWTFNPIYLVDSATNPEGSMGYVTFSVKKKAGLPIGTQIKNTAHIYFDYNDAIVTNTVTTRLADPNSIYNVSNDAAINVIAAPNPFTQQTQLTVEGITGTFNFELFDVSGKLLKKINALADSRFTINRESMSAGVYFYSITTTQKQKAFGRLVVE